MKIIANNYKANETFKFLRQGLDLTQEELAKNIKASKSSIEKYEYGTVNYTFETLLKIAEKYNLNIIIETKKINFQIGSLFNYLLSVSSLATIFFKTSAVACFNSATLFSITGVPFSTANLYNSSAFF